MISKKREINAIFIAATLVDWKQSTITNKMQKKLRKAMKRSLGTSKFSNNRINTFAVCQASSHLLPNVERRKRVEKAVTKVFSEYAHTINKKYSRELRYNGDSKIYKDALKSLNMDDIVVKLIDKQHTYLDKVDKKIEYIVSHASVSIWDLPGHENDRIVLPEIIVSFDSEAEGDLTSMIDELVITNLARYFLPFSKEILTDTKLRLEELDNIITMLGDVQIPYSLESLLRNFIGTISGLQESLKLFKREVERINYLAIDTVDELKKFPSKKMQQWLNVDYTVLGVELITLIEVIDGYIINIKPQLRRMLTRKDLKVIDNFHSFLSKVVEVKALSPSLLHWVNRFEDLPSFTALDNGIAFETVEHEEYSPTENVLLETQNLFKIYNRGGRSIYALRGVNLTVKKGAFTIIHGPSGSGKTTLLNLLAGLDSANRGAVFFNQENLLEMRDGKRTSIRRKNFSFIFQTYALIPHLNAFENTKVPLDLGGFSKELKEGIQELLDNVGIGKFATHKPSHLSGGQMQRLGIARALVNRPAVIFADEPTGDLDDATGLKILDLMKRYHKETGVTILLVTHNQNLLRYGTDEIYMKDGQIQYYPK